MKGDPSTHTEKKYAFQGCGEIKKCALLQSQFQQLPWFIIHVGIALLLRYTFTIRFRVHGRK